VIRLWRRFMAWLNADDVLAYIEGHNWPPPARPLPPPPPRHHCATCAKGVRKG
jgi:hypothetical protein